MCMPELPLFAASLMIGLLPSSFVFVPLLILNSISEGIKV